MLTNEKLKRHLAAFPVRHDIKVAVISGPTAIGKHTIVSKLERTHRFLVPTTTRPPLRDEVNGINYYFVTKTDFVRGLLNGKYATGFMLENHYYGFSVEELEKATSSQYKTIAIIYYKVLDQFIEKFPNSFIHFMFPPFTNNGLELIKRRMLSKTVWNFEQRWRDTLEQMNAMYVTRPTLLEKYPNSRLYKIKDDRSTSKLIKDLQKFK
jgi:guanylate kinase